jgi:choline dehydrogenase-like flavoprotein
MMIDARGLPTDQVIQTEVCIIGSGPAGLTLAHEFAGQNFRVCLLESGGLELPDPATASLSEVETVGDFKQVLPDTRNRRFGGNSSYWGIYVDQNNLGLRHRPLDEVDFEKRDWLPHSGWAFDRSHLLPYYQRAHQVLKMSEFAYEPEDWEDAQAKRLPLVGDRVRTSMFRFSAAKTFFEDYRQEIDQSPNITTYLHANAVELETDETAQTVQRVRVACLTGNQFWVNAKIVIMAAGAVENTHLLLNSRQVQPEGLGNSFDLVGRFFMDHPLIAGGTFIPSKPQLFNETALYDLRRVNNTPVMGALSLADETIRREQVLNITAWLFPRPKRLNSSEAISSLKDLATLQGFKQGPKQALGHAYNVVTGAGDIVGSIYDKVTRKPQPFWPNLSTGGWSHLQSHREKAYGVFEVLQMAEQAPHWDNRVTLSDQRDKLGRQQVQMQTQWHKEDVSSFKRGQQIIADELARAGLGQFVFNRDENDMPIVASNGASHHIGTTRMHVDPKQGVVNANCQVHGVSNLYVASSSVFPTGGYANPTLTIVALSIRIADRVKSQMAEKILTHSDNQIKPQISEVLKTDGLTQRAKTPSAASQTLPLSLPQ